MGRVVGELARTKQSSVVSLRPTANKTQADISIKVG